MIVTIRALKLSEVTDISAEQSPIERSEPQRFSLYEFTSAQNKDGYCN